MANITIDKLKSVNQLSSAGLLVVSDTDQATSFTVTRNISGKNLYKSMVDLVQSADITDSEGALQEYLEEKKFLLDDSKKIDYDRLADAILNKLKDKNYYSEENPQGLNLFSAISNLNNDIDGLNNNIQTINSSITDINNKIPNDISSFITETELNYVTSYYNNSITSLSTSISDLNTSLNNVNNSITSLTSSFNNYITTTELTDYYSLNINDVNLEGSRMKPFKYGFFDDIHSLNELPNCSIGYGVNAQQIDSEAQAFPTTGAYSFISFGHSQRSRTIIAARASTSGEMKVYINVRYRPNYNSDNAQWTGWKAISTAAV